MAIQDLDAIADYIALDNPEAAQSLVQRVFQQIEQLAKHPLSGPAIPKLGRSRCRQIVEAPCRLFYRYDGRKVIILAVMRGEQKFRKARLTKRKPKALSPNTPAASP